MGGPLNREALGFSRGNVTLDDMLTRHQGG